MQALQSQTTNEYIWAQKLFIKRQGRSSKIYSDNAQTINSASKRVKRLVEYENLHDYIAQQKYIWYYDSS